jgi:hypothetical protein
MTASPQSARVAEAMDTALAAEQAAEVAVLEAQRGGALAVQEATERAARSRIVAKSAYDECTIAAYARRQVDKLVLEARRPSGSPGGPARSFRFVARPGGVVVDVLK